jgi:serine/threonine-protein kinase ATR
MTRNDGDGTQSDCIGGHTMLPPSTLAAQIVDRHARNDLAGDPEEKALFDQLLQEYLKDPSSTDVPDYQINAKLIAVVVEAGLEVLRSGDPFNVEPLLQQAENSLRVITLIVQKSPELLFYQPIEENGAKGPCLCIWLVAKLISLLGHASLHALHGPITNMLHEISRTLQDIPGQSNKALLFQNVFVESVNGIYKMS